MVRADWKSHAADCLFSSSSDASRAQLTLSLLPTAWRSCRHPPEAAVAHKQPRTPLAPCHMPTPACQLMRPGALVCSRRLRTRSSSPSCARASSARSRTRRRRNRAPRACTAPAELGPRGGHCALPEPLIRTRASPNPQTRTFSLGFEPAPPLARSRLEYAP